MSSLKGLLAVLGITMVAGIGGLLALEEIFLKRHGKDQYNQHIMGKDKTIRSDERREEGEEMSRGDSGTALNGYQHRDNGDIKNDNLDPYLIPMIDPYIDSESKDGGKQA